MRNAVLKQEQLSSILREFKNKYSEKYSLKSLGYFGSYARNEADVDSDIDIVFDTDNPNLFKTSLMRQELQELLNIPVDIVRLRENMNPNLKQRILEEAKYV